MRAIFRAICHWLCKRCHRKDERPYTPAASVVDEFSVKETPPE